MQGDQETWQRWTVGAHNLLNFEETPHGLASTPSALAAYLNDLEARLTAAEVERDEYKRCYEMQREVTNNWQAEAERRGHKTDDAEAKVELLTGQLRHAWDEHDTQYHRAEAAEAKATRLETALREIRDHAASPATGASEPSAKRRRNEHD